MYDEHKEVIDYEMILLPGMNRRIRGPAPETLAPGQYFSCLGAAQTFGCFCEKPYPDLVADSLRLPSLNFGFAGVGPRFFLPRWFVQDDTILNYVNGGRFAIVQVMSGRSEDNSLFASEGSEYLKRRSDGKRIGAEPAYKELLATENVEHVQAVVEETRANWVESFSSLLRAIRVPTILFWFSQRSPDFEDNYSDVFGLFGEFPHMVNRAMVDQIRDLSDEYVECISTRGFPQRLISRTTGEPVSVETRADLGYTWNGFNLYYPSPEMQADAAMALLDTCRKYTAKAP